MATKTAKIEITNFKAVSEFDADFKGCTAFITGGNNRGKSSLLRGIADRIRGEKPELVVKYGEKEGKGILTLTSGEKFEWEFDSNGKDKLVFYTKEGYRSAVTKAISTKFFPPLFDIDSFLNSTPAQQSKMLQQLAGISFTEIDAEYKVAYDERTVANRLKEDAKGKLIAIVKDVPDELIDESALSEQIGGIAAYNTLYKTSQNRHEENKKSVEQQELTVADLKQKLELAEKELVDKKAKVDIGEKWLNTEANKPKDAEKLQEELSNAVNQNQLVTSNREAKQRQLHYQKVMADADALDMKVQGIAARKKQMILDAKFPDGIELTDDGIKIDGFPLDKNQISSSKLYCTALRLASLNLGEVRTLHFDASTLDRNTLADIEKWAVENDCQLLIERPDFEGGEIKYELIQSNN